MTDEIRIMDRRGLQALVGGTAQILAENGGYKIVGVTLLSPGTWTEGGGTTIHYGEQLLQQYAKNWEETGLWIIHTMGMQRRVTDNIGNIKNPRFESGVIKGDLYFHLKTQASRDAFELVAAGIRGEIPPTSFSIEHTGKDRYDPINGCFEAESLIFLGGAIVLEGASGGTKILSKLENKTQPTIIEKPEVKTELESPEAVKEEPIMEPTEIESKMADFEKRLASLECAKPKEMAAPVVEPVVPEQPKEISIVENPKIAELEKAVGELTAKVTELSKQPVVTREMSTPEIDNRIFVRKVKNVDGTIMGA